MHRYPTRLPAKAQDVLLSHWSVTSTGMTPVPLPSGSRASPTTDPSIWLRSAPSSSCPGRDDVTNRLPTRMGPFSAVALPARWRDLPGRCPVLRGAGLPATFLSSLRLFLPMGPITKNGRGRDPTP